MKKLLIALSVIGVIGVSQGCSLIGDDCDVAEASCASATRITTCEATDDGVSHSFTDDCPTEQRCVSLPDHIAECQPSDVGGSCKTDAGCNPWLRCVGGFCVAAPDAIVTACNAAPLVTVPNDGSIAHITVTIDQSDPTFVPLLLRPAQAPNVARFGIVRFDESSTYTGIHLGPSDAQIFDIIGTTCAQLYNGLEQNTDALIGDPTPVAVVIVNAGSTATTVEIDAARE